MSAVVLPTPFVGAEPVVNPRRRNQWFPKGVVDLHRYRVRRRNERMSASSHSELLQSQLRSRAEMNYGTYSGLAQAEREQANRPLFELALACRAEHVRKAELFEKGAAEWLAQCGNDADGRQA